jgi:hydrogenase-4 component E
MSLLVDLVLIFFILVGLWLLAADRLGTCIRLTAAQGILLSSLPLLLAEEIGMRAVVFALGILLLKGVVFPRLLLRTLRSVNIRHELEPFIGYAASLAAGIGFLALSFWIASSLTLPWPRHESSRLVLPIALASILMGLFLIVVRRKAMMQVVGYLVMENGIYIFGIAVAGEVPFLVETGILLDVFAAVFIMGIAIFHINREFDHIDVEKLTSLKD